MPSVVREMTGDTVAILRLNRPDRLNAVNQELYHELVAALDELAADESVRAVVLTGAGRGFCVGADLKDHHGREPERPWLEAYVQLAQDAAHRLQTLPKPVVAAVNGHAIGAGLELALSCDFIVAAETAKLRLPEVALATFLGGGVFHTLERRVGLGRAREIIMVCEFLTGGEALPVGLVDRAVPTERVMPEALALAETLAARSPRAFAHAKQLFRLAPELAPDALMDREREALLDCMGRDDWREGITAFNEKRQPRYTGS